MFGIFCILIGISLLSYFGIVMLQSSEEKSKDEAELKVDLWAGIQIDEEERREGQ